MFARIMRSDQFQKYAWQETWSRLIMVNRNRCANDNSILKRLIEQQQQQRQHNIIIIQYLPIIWQTGSMIESSLLASHSFTVSYDEMKHYLLICEYVVRVGSNFTFHRHS